MANKKISELTLLDTVSANLQLTVLPVLDTSSGTTRKVTLQQLNDSIEANIPFAAAAFTQANTANVNAISSGLYANSAFGVSNSASSYSNSAFSVANTANTNVVTSGSYANSAYGVANSANSNIVTSGLYANSAYAAANVSDQKATSSGNYANSAYTQANTSNTNIITVGDYANSAFSKSNSSNTLAQAAYDASNTSDQKAVTSGDYANSAYGIANTANTNAISSGSYANASFTRANNSLNVSIGGSITGNIVVNGNVTANYFSGNGSLLTDISNSFDLEMHVSKDGNDSTGTGTILRPYLTITHALTQVTGGRNTIVIHPGGYTENPTITSLATQLITYDATGASTLVYGTVTIANTTGRIAGLKMTNLAITGNAQAYINSSTVDEQFTKSSSGYVEVDDCELQTTGNVLISGSGITTIIGNKINNLVVNNAGAQVLIKGANDCLMPQVIAGTLNIVDSVIRASSNTANAVTASVGTVVTLMNNQIVTPTADNVARVSIAGYHSIISVVYDKANSTLSNSLNSVVYFQTANVDSLVSSSNIAGNNISATSVSTNVLNVKNVFETTNALSAATGTVTHNCALGQIFVHSSISANFTANFTNVTLPANNATAFTLVLNQGGTAYVPTAVQIGGQAQTVNWQGGTQPAGSANKKDVVSFSVVNNNGTFITLGQLTTFG